MRTPLLANAGPGAATLLMLMLPTISLGCDRPPRVTETPGGSASTAIEGREHLPNSVAASDDPDEIDPHDFDALAQRLGNEGLVGHLHASVQDSRTFVFTFRKKGDFFDYVDLTLIPRNDAALAALAGLRRHDEVRLFGELAELDAPQPHLYVERVELVEAWEPPRKVPAHDYDAQAQLSTPTTVVAKVHAVDADGRVLVLEIGDRVFPVVVERTELTRDLWRNDEISIALDRAGHPGTPMHLVLDRKAKAPIEVLDRIEDGHGQPLTLEGQLVLFPDSPQLMFDIYALQVQDAAGIRRNYTLVNFEDMDAFEAIRAKLAAAWGDAPGVEARNKLIHPTVKIRARGTKNVVSPSQANPQLLLEGPDAIELIVD